MPQLLTLENRKELEDKILKNTRETASGCLEWTGSLSKYGYGYFYFKGRAQPYIAHRVAYELANGEIPAGMSVAHTCSNKLCVNWEHLRLVTKSTPVKTGRSPQTQAEYWWKASGFVTNPSRETILKTYMDMQKKVRSALLEIMKKQPVTQIAKEVGCSPITLKSFVFNSHNVDWKRLFKFEQYLQSLEKS